VTTLDPSNLSRDLSHLSRDLSHLSRDLSYLDPEVTAAFRRLPVETFTYSAFAPAPGCGEAVVVVGGETEVWQILGRFSNHFYQCCGSGSGSTGSTCFWVSWIRIRILLSLSKYSKKNLDFYCFVTSFWLFIFEKWRKSTFKK
jgi:hypothetical protein